LLRALSDPNSEAIVSKTKDAPTSPWEKLFDPGELYTLADVAERCKVTERQVLRWTHEGRVEFVRLPRGRRILGQRMIDFLRGRVEER
jgi:excisionase family DNA binding protein